MNNMSMKCAPSSKEKEENCQTDMLTGSQPVTMLSMTMWPCGSSHGPPFLSLPMNARGAPVNSF